MSDAPRTKLSLIDHKLVVKSWNRRPHQKATTTTTRIESDDQAIVWLRRQQKVNERNEFTARSKDTSVPEDDLWDTNSDSAALEASPEEHGDDQACCPKTVGHIKHAYRSRARQQEIADGRKAQILAKKQREKMMQYQFIKQPSHSPSSFKNHSRSVDQIVHGTSCVDTTNGEEPNALESEPSNDLFHLNAQGLLTSGDYRDTLLRSIRHELSSGRNVLLSVPLMVPGLSHGASDIKLALQQLCSQSLLFCVRDQEVIPTIEDDVASMELLTRHMAK